MERIQERYGSKISVLAPLPDLSGDVSFRCNVCGTVFSKKPKSILLGRGCPECSNATIIPYEEFKCYVNALSDGRYEILEAKASGNFVIRDTITGITKSHSKQMIVQELTRPTDSICFPLNNAIKEKVKTLTKKASNVIMNHLEGLKTESGYFYYSDLFTALVDSGVLSKREFILGWVELLPQKHFRKIQENWRLYVFEGTVVDYEQILNEKYVLDKDGRHIGYFSGRTFLKNLGIACNGNRSITVVTNLAKLDETTKCILDGAQLRIESPQHGEINEENYKYKMLLTIFQASYFEKTPENIARIGQYISDSELTLSGFYKELENNYSSYSVARFENFVDSLSNLNILIPK